VAGSISARARFEQVSRAGFLFFPRRSAEREHLEEQFDGPLAPAAPGTRPRLYFQWAGSHPKIYHGRNRTFFFSAYEYDTFLDSTLIDALVPVDQNPLFPLPAPTNLQLKKRREPFRSGIEGRKRVAPFVASISTPQRNHIFTTRVDHKFTDMHNGSFLYQLGRLTNLRQLAVGAVWLTV